MLKQCIWLISWNLLVYASAEQYILVPKTESTQIVRCFPLAHSPRTWLEPMLEQNGIAIAAWILWQEDPQTNVITYSSTNNPAHTSYDHRSAIPTELYLKRSIIDKSKSTR